MNIIKMPVKINKKKTYYCPKCGEWFRLKMALNNHKCEEKERKYD